MTTDLYTDLRQDVTYQKLMGSGYMLVEYQCPIEAEHFRLYTESDFLIYVFSGRKDWLAGGQTYVMHEGDAYLIPKGAYVTRQYRDHEHCIMLFFLEDQFIRDFMLENHRLPVNAITPGLESTEVMYKVHVNPPLKTLFRSVFEYLQWKTEVPKNLVELKFKELLFQLMLDPENHHIAGYLQQVAQAGKPDLERIMLRHFQYDLNPEAFARICGRSLSAFKRDFEHQFGTTPGKWLKEKRLQFAKALIQGSDLHVSEVALQSGFRNVSHFNKAFKERFGIPPRQVKT